MFFFFFFFFWHTINELPSESGSVEGNEGADFGYFAVANMFLFLIMFYFFIFFFLHTINKLPSESGSVEGSEGAGFPCILRGHSHMRRLWSASAA